jgi:hypothetical protein
MSSSVKPREIQKFITMQEINDGKLSKRLEKLEYGNPISILRYGNPIAILLSLGEFCDLMELQRMATETSKKIETTQRG